jgi:folate-binding protein YgfZ
MPATALHEKLASVQARLEEYSGAATAADFGDLGAEFRALLSTCGVYDLGWRAKIEVTGKDRVRWLNGMVTNNIRDLPIGRGAYAFLLKPQGQILGDLYAYNRGESLLLDTSQSQAETIFAILKRYIIMDDVQLTPAGGKLTAIGLAGPRSREVLGGAGFELPDLAPLQFVDLTWQQTELTVVRGDNPAVESFELWLAPADAATLWEALSNAGAVPAGARAQELLRIASGVPRYGQDIHERDLPQETDQQRALNFTKGCYIGQEIVERIRSRGAVHRKLTGFSVEGPAPAPGSKIQADGKDVGEVTSVACLPLVSGEKNVAFGYLRREAEAGGKSLEAGGAKLTVANIPFAEAFQNQN